MIEKYVNDVTHLHNCVTQTVYKAHIFETISSQDIGFFIRAGFISWPFFQHLIPGVRTDEKKFSIRHIHSLSNKKNNFMRSLLYLVAVILIVGWLVGFFGFHAPALIHVLLVIGIIIILFSVIKGRRIV